MTTARLRSRIETAETKAGVAAGDDTYRVFSVKGGSGYVASGNCADDVEAFLRSQGHDVSGNVAVIHFVPWDSGKQCFRDEPLVDLTAEYRGKRAA